MSWLPGSRPGSAEVWDGLYDRAMDHYSILDHSSPPAMQARPEPALETDVQQPITNRMSPSVSPGMISAAIAAENEAAATNSSLASAGPSPARFPKENGGRSLAGMAQCDLDAALQLLAERAQYITEASGAAIALRRNQQNDMLCRASVGTNAPELGALLSTESGLSGESVRTRSPLRCDDTERDPRVNREGCRDLGIASVVVMPIVRDDYVLGVFELFSGKAGAFGERDLSALQRLGEMVETAVKLAETAQGLSSHVLAEACDSDAQSILDPAILLDPSPVEVPLADAHIDEVEAEILAPDSSFEEEVRDVAAIVTAVKEIAVATPQQVAASPEPPPKASPPTKPVLWSASSHAAPEMPKPAQADQSHVPPVLRNLHKCWACGFPVSEGRKLCVECEEKQWRGRLGVPVAAVTRDVAGAAVPRVVSSNQALAAAAGAAALPGTKVFPAGQVKSETSMPASGQAVAQITAASAADTPEIQSNAPVLTGGMESESWLSANKYIVGALLLVAIVVAAIALLR